MLTGARAVFWDFDGVIKESVSVKTEAFVQLFRPFGPRVCESVRSHHLANGGMSRFDKLPVYLEWAGLPSDEAHVADYCDRFSNAVFENVVTAPWVPGVEDYLRQNRHQQRFFLVTATPQEEIERILSAIDLQTCFLAVFGAPTLKSEAIRQTISDRGLVKSECVMVGDATADMAAAENNAIPFLLRRHADNVQAFLKYDGPFVEDFSGL
ncbi:HAD family hydrolase [Nitrogeniibacter mangrovi]|uniref:HAD family hydrolase n=1 Tax=Nitrogeniibacter mangrovi TaxID=2016596 RepID=UPI001E331519|nr:HAD hydrolase-like protein [Nitrogeniibacter mangrovi]